MSQDYQSQVWRETTERWGRAQKDGKWALVQVEGGWVTLLRRKSHEPFGMVRPKLPPIRMPLSQPYIPLPGNVSDAHVSGGGPSSIFEERNLPPTRRPSLTSLE